jgi:hypothetical protein
MFSARWGTPKDIGCKGSQKKWKIKNLTIFLPKNLVLKK